MAYEINRQCLRGFVSSCGYGSRSRPPRQRRPQVRAPEHDEGDRVVRVPEAVALPDRDLYLVVHGLHAGVGDAERDGAQDPVALAPDLPGELDELRYPAPARPGEPAVELARRLARGRPGTRPAAPPWAGSRARRRPTRPFHGCGRPPRSCTCGHSCSRSRRRRLSATPSNRPRPSTSSSEPPHAGAYPAHGTAYALTPRSGHSTRRGVRRCR